jgi:hypothetical protein
LPASAGLTPCATEGDSAGSATAAEVMSAPARRAPAAAVNLGLPKYVMDLFLSVRCLGK